MDIYDREEQIDQLITCNVTCPPPGSGPEICYTSNVLEFLLPGIPERLKSEVLGSNNHLSLTTPSAQFATEGGWASLSFREEQHRMNPLSGVAYFGLPVTGFAVQQFTNAGAGPGLLAQYGGLYKHKGVVVTDEELVD